MAKTWDRKNSTLRNISVTDEWVPLAERLCSKVSMLNSTGDDIRVCFVGSESDFLTISNGGIIDLNTSNASQIQIQADAGAAGIQLIID